MKHAWSPPQVAPGGAVVRRCKRCRVSAFTVFTGPARVISWARGEAGTRSYDAVPQCRVVARPRKTSAA